MITLVLQIVDASREAEASVAVECVQWSDELVALEVCEDEVALGWCLAFHDVMELKVSAFSQETTILGLFRVVMAPPVTEWVEPEVVED